MTALYAVKNHLVALGGVSVTVAKIIVQPQPENNEHADSYIKDKKGIYFEADHCLLFFAS